MATQKQLDFVNKVATEKGLVQPALDLNSSYNMVQSALSLMGVESKPKPSPAPVSDDRGDIILKRMVQKEVYKKWVQLALSDPLQPMPLDDAKNFLIEVALTVNMFKA